MRLLLYHTYDPTVLALKSGAGTVDGPTRAGTAEWGTTCRAVESGTWTVGAGRCRAAGQGGAGANSLAGKCTLRREIRKTGLDSTRMCTEG